MVSGRRLSWVDSRSGVSPPTLRSLATTFQHDARPVPGMFAHLGSRRLLSSAVKTGSAGSAETTRPAYPAVAGFRSWRAYVVVEESVVRETVPITKALAWAYSSSVRCAFSCSVTSRSSCSTTSLERFPLIKTLVIVAVMAE